MRDKLYVGFRLILILGVVSLLSQCRKDESTTTIIDNTLVMDHEDVSFLITVVDEEHNLLSESSMVIANDIQIYTPDDNGLYVIKSINVPDIGRRINISKEGYYKQIKMLTGENNSKNILEVILIKEKEGIVINTGTNGAIEGGGSLRLPESLVLDNGTVYTGAVKVESHYYNPDQSEYIQQAPGNMLGLTSKDEYVILGSLGMYLIELSNPDNGEELNIPEGSTATLSFPVANTQSGDIPASIPLWSMDEDLGIWIYEGEAKLDGDMMIAEVSHFSWWNCDLPYIFLPFCATFVDFWGEVVTGLKVNAFVNNQGFGNTYTDNSGKICGKLPKDELINFRLTFDNELLDEVEVGPFVDAPIDITIEAPSLFDVIGVAVDCSSALVTDGYGLVKMENETIPIYYNSEGKFHYKTIENQAHSLLLVDQTSNTSLNIEVESSDITIDLGIRMICDQVQRGAFSGTVMLDTDEDGTSDTPVEGAIVKLRNVLTGLIDYSLTSDADGKYIVEAIPMVDYVIFIEEVSGRSLIYQGDNSPDDNVDKEEWTSITRDGIGIAARLEDAMELDEDNDFQLVTSGVGIVSGNVMVDLDGDMVGDMPRVNYELSILSFTQGTEKETVVTTDANGVYRITMPNFIGEIKSQSYTILDFDTSPDPDGDDSTEGANSTIPIRLTNGEDDMDNNYVLAGNGMISGNVSEDTDNDNVGDAPIEGIEIIINAPLNEFPKSTTTNADGYYEFTDLPPGEYTLTQQDEALFDEDFVDVFDGDESPEDADDAVDGLKDDIIEVTLTVGESDEDNNFVEEQLGSISGHVFLDTNNDDLGDVPIDGVEITLTDVGAGTVVTTLTDADGNYQFTDLEPGEYTVTEQDEAELGVGFVDVFDGDETPEDADDAVDALNDDSIEVTLIPGEDDEDNNFIEEQLGTIRGSVTLDTDNDDIGDTTQDGVVVTWLDQNGDVIAITVTDMDGNFVFEEVEPGDYSVTTEDPTGSQSVSDDDATPEDANDNNGIVDNAISVTVEPGENDADNNFVDRPE